MDALDLAERRRIFQSFAYMGSPPPFVDAERLRSLAQAHLVVLDAAGRIVMAHPFAVPGSACRVESGGRTWWGSCAWDGLGIVAALGLSDARVVSNGIEATDDVLFYVGVPASAWWDDIVFT